MVIQRQPTLASSIFQNSENRNYFKQEFDCIQRSVLLDPINMVELRPSVFSTVIYPFLLALSVFLVTLLLSLSNYIRPLELSGMGLLFFGFLFYSYSAGISYRMFLKKDPDTKLLTYVYVCMYSMTYFPLAITLTLILGPIGSIMMFALVLLTQYVLMNTLCLGYDFPTNTRRFLFSLLTLVFQFVFIIGLESLIVNRTRILKL